MPTARLKSRWCRVRAGLTAVSGTLICAAVVVFLDVVLDGGYVFSALVCPIWFLVGVLRTVVRHPGLGVTAARILIPVTTVLLVAANYGVQGGIVSANADRLIQACERYREANGAYPERLDNLVPRYLNSIPRAKYRCLSSQFSYYASSQRHTLSWCELPPFGRSVYIFETGEWRCVD
jgi:hypothetical protein